MLQMTAPAPARRVIVRRVKTVPRSSAQSVYRDILSDLNDDQLIDLEAEITAFLDGEGIGQRLSVVLQAAKA